MDTQENPERRCRSYTATWRGVADDPDGLGREASVTATFHIDPRDEDELLREWGVASLEDVPTAAAGWALWYEATDAIREQIAGDTSPFPVDTLCEGPGDDGMNALALGRATDRGQTVQIEGAVGDVTWGVPA